MSAWFDMGGHGPYVWGSYGLFVAVLLWDLLVPIWRRRRLLRSLSLKLRRDAARKSS
ncbi:MAG: heme exporter protein CcmD [Xanthomonadaceae bacterium]|nr:heme exporter protein CcmD [Xanthomonadaceae bacterium]